MNLQPDPEIQILLEEIHLAEEPVRVDASHYLQEYRAQCLARPKRAFVDLQRVILKTKLKQLVRAAHRDGMFR